MATAPSDTRSANGCKGHSVNLNNRSRVDASSPEVIVAHAEYHHRRSHKGGVVHVVGRSWQL